MSPSRREREYARRRYEKWAARQQERAAARRRTQRNAIAIGLTVIVVLGIAIGAALLRRTSSSTEAAAPAPSPSAAPSAGASPSASAGASNAANPCPAPTVKPPATPGSWKSAPPKSLAEGKSWKLTMKTSCGTIVATLDGAKAPQAVASAIFLARNNFWNGTPCHRLTTEGIYVLQCGDPTGSGSGGPGYQFGPVENAPKDGDYPAGTIAMARTQDPNSNGSQFFLVYKDTKLPDPTGYTVMGRITEGLDVVTKVAEGGAEGGSDGKPVRPISLVSTSVSPA